MNCPIETRHTEMLVSYTAGELDQETALMLEQHFAVCPACQSTAMEQSAVWKALDAWEIPPVSLDFDRRLYSRIDAGTRPSWWERLTLSFRPMPLRQTVPLAATAGLLLMAGLLLHQPGPVGSSTAPPSHIVRADQVETTLDDLELLRQFGPPNSAESVHPDAM
jgi:anti-sigma factor RsiW